MSAYLPGLPGGSLLSAMAPRPGHSVDTIELFIQTANSIANLVIMKLRV